MIILFYDKGVGATDISRQMNIGRSTVYKILQDYKKSEKIWVYMYLSDGGCIWKLFQAEKLSVCFRSVGLQTPYANKKMVVFLLKKSLFYLFAALCKNSNSLSMTSTFFAPLLKGTLFLFKCFCCLLCKQKDGIIKSIVNYKICHLQVYDEKHPKSSWQAV